MRMKADCLVCLYQQMLRVGRAMECDDACTTAILKRSAEILESLPMDQTPPEAAAILYPRVAEIAGSDDPYARQKRESIRKASAILPRVEERVREARSVPDAALRAAVAGNVIDFATEVSFELEEEIEKIFSADFAIDHKERFLSRLEEARHLAVIGDNVGEHLFDKLMMRQLKENYPHLSIDYLVRGRPIINDVTVAEAREAGIGDVARIVDSGVDTPGFLYERAGGEGRAAFDRADLILAKGMGNFECMESWADERVFFLFKVKCSVVAGKIGREIGDLICMEAAND